MRRDGFSLIDLILAIGIIATLFGGIFLVYFSVVDTAVNYELRRAASSVMNQKVELVRNLGYDQVGVVGGIPAGVLQQSEQVEWDGAQFIVQTVVRNVDDPFDGTVGGSPGDTAPADYKLVEFTVSCPTCQRFTPVSLTTTVAPEGLESASQNGSLFINVFDADGQPVPSAEVTIINASTTPTINFTDITNDAGSLQLVNVPTSTQSYQILVTKDGYSTEQTYPAGAPGNPNPAKTHATVGTQTVTALSFAIDELSTVVVATSGARCEVVASEPFSMTGSKLIGTLPDVIKYATTSNTGLGGELALALEWDTYALSYSGSRHLVGTVPLVPFAVAPGVGQSVRLVLAPAAGNALSIVATDAGTGAPIAASITLDGPGAFAATGMAGEAAYVDSDWSSTSTYSAVSGIDTSSGAIAMGPQGGPYSTSTISTLESATIDLGGTPAGVFSLSWDADVPSGAVRFQVAGSDDGTSWNFVGPDGGSGTYFTSNAAVSGSAAGKRFFRYKAYLETGDPNQTPSVSEVSLSFTGPCVPPGQRLFQSLPLGSYVVDVTAPGYAPGSANVTVGSGWQSITVAMTPS